MMAMSGAYASKVLRRKDGRSTKLELPPCPSRISLRREANTVRIAIKPQLARSPWATAARPADVLVPERFPDLGQQAVGAGPTLDYANTPAFFAELQSVIGAGLKRTRH